MNIIAINKIHCKLFYMKLYDGSVTEVPWFYLVLKIIMFIYYLSL